MLLITGKKWKAVAEVGLHAPEAHELEDPENRLVRLDFIRPESVPHPWAPAIAFATHLRRAQEPAASLALELFELYLKGLVTGILRLEVGEIPVPAREGPSLGGLLRSTWPGKYPRLGVLKFGSEVAAGHHPDCLFFPAAVFSGWPDGMSEIEEEMRTAIEREFDRNFDCQVIYGQNMEVLRAAGGGAAWRAAVEALFNQGRVPRAEGGPGEIEASELPKLEAKGFGEIALRVPSPPLVMVLGGEAPPGSPVERTLAGSEIYDGFGRTRHLGDLKPDHLGALYGVGLPLVYDRERDVWYSLEDPKLFPPPEGWKVTRARGYVTFSGPYRGFDIELHVHAETASPEQVFCSRVARITSPAGGARFPDIPVRKQFRELVKSAEVVGDGGKEVTYHIGLANGASVKWTAQVVNLTGDDAFVLGVWPGFVADGWTEYRVHLTSPACLAEVRDADGRTIAFENTGQTLRMQGWPQGFRISWEGEDLGWFDAGREHARLAGGGEVLERARGGGEVTVALDFGTSNSLLAVRWPGEEVGPVQEARFTVGWALLAGTGEDLGRARKQAKVTDLTDASEVPSQIAAWEDLRNLDRLDEAVRWSTITPPRSDLTALHGLVREGRILSGFKWDDGRFWPRRTGNLVEEIRAARRAYLDDLLLSLAAELAPKAGNVRLRAGFPEAFSTTQASAFLHELEHVTGRLGHSTGLRWNVAGLVSESLAAMQAAGKIGEHDYVAGVDVGGGSSDSFALSAAEAIGAAAGEERFASSLRLAGHHILEAVGAALARRGLLEGATDRVDAVRQRAILLSAAARECLSRRVLGAGVEGGVLENDFIEYLRKQGLIGAEAGDDILTAIGLIVNRAFLAILHWSLLPIATRLLEDYRQQRGIDRGVSVGFALLGHGWSLLRLTREGWEQWMARPGEADAVEVELGRQLVARAWEAIANTVPLPRAPEFLKGVPIKVFRLSEKKNTVVGMVEAPVKDLKDLAALRPREPLGLWTDEAGHEMLPKRFSEEGRRDWLKSTLKSVTVWGIPPAVGETLGGKEWEESIGATVRSALMDGSAWATRDVVGKEFLELQRSPLRKLYEGKLVEKLVELGTKPEGR